MGEGVATVLSAGERFDNVHAHRDFSDSAFTAIAAFDLAKSVNLYAKAADAYKSGGFNDRDPHISGASEENTYGFGFVEGFAPEHGRSYEVGVKSEWFKRRLRLNADVFTTQYRDMQINFLIPGTISDTKTRNAGRAHVRGLEVDLALSPMKGLVLSAEYALLDAEIEEVRDAAGNNVADDYKFASAPRHFAVATVDWTFLQGGWGNLRGYLNYNYVGERFGSPSLTDFRGGSIREARSLLNARLAAGNMPALGGFFDVSLWGRNLTDVDYTLDAIDNLPQANRAVIWGEPLTVGADVIYRFY
jgi:iron complex outermembrane recepter protein